MPRPIRVETAPLVLGILLALAVLGEIVEFAAGSAAANRAGGSRHGAVGRAWGHAGRDRGCRGQMPVPIIGSAVAAVLGGAFGALAGAITFEFHGGRDLAASWHVGHAAFWGRLFGTLSKAALGT